MTTSPLHVLSHARHRSVWAFLKGGPGTDQSLHGVRERGLALLEFEDPDTTT